jgi:hypothetical protein
MKGYPYLLYSFYGEGRVVLCSSHPEPADKATGSAAMVPEIVRWLAGRDPKRPETDGDDYPRPKKRYLELEKVDQLPSYCALAAMEMVLRYWGYPEHTQRRIAHAIEEAFPKWEIGPAKRGEHGRGTRGDMVLWYFQHKAPKGFVKRTGVYEPNDDDPAMPEPQTAEREAACRALLEQLKSHIAKGRPVLFRGYTYGPPETYPVRKGTKDFGRHWRVAVGYDETAQPPTITVMDPSTSTQERVWSEELFMKYWDVTNPAHTHVQGWNLWMLIYDPRSSTAARR